MRNKSIQPHFLSLSYVTENVDADGVDLFEGDMVLDPMQWISAEFGLDIDATGARGSIKNRQWPNGVVFYTITSSLCKH